MIGSARWQREPGKKWVIWKFFMRSIAPSTWMRSVAIRRVATGSSSSNCGRPPRNRGMLTPVLSGIIPLMSNPRSAMTVSSSSRSWSNLLRFVISLSDIRPPQSGDRNAITLFGETPTSSLNVFVFLLFDHVAAWTSGLAGFSILNSIASMTTRVLGYFFAKPRGMYSFTSNLDGQMFISLKEWYKHRTNMENVLDTVYWLTAKRTARSDSGKLCRSLTNVRSNSSSEDSLLWVYWGFFPACSPAFLPV